MKTQKQIESLLTVLIGMANDLIETAVTLEAAIKEGIVPPVVVPPVVVPPVVVPPVAGIMRVDARMLLDSKNRPFVCRGLELIVGPERGPTAGRSGGITDVVSATKANAFRPNKFDGLSDAEILAIHKRTVALGMVPYVTCPEGPGLPWFNRPAVKSVLQAMPNIVLDALLESPASNVATWRADAKRAIATMRGYGYRNVLSIHSIQQGRNLREILNYGAEILASDPEKNILFGCQMYWPTGQGFEWQAEQGFGSGMNGISEAFRLIGLAPFAIQLGFATGDENARPSPNGDLLKLAAKYNVGWLWWDWTGVGDDDKDSLSYDGTLTNLTPAGQMVLNTHPDGFRTAKRV